MLHCAVDTHYIEDVERAQGVFGAGESSAAHLQFKQTVNTVKSLKRGVK